jgi:hypothetical protein
MKKSLVLGAATLAAVAFALPAPSDAGEVKMGGYYQFRVLDADDTLADDGDEVAGQADDNYWVHRLQLNMDFIASPKSHAHMVTRVIDSNTVEGASGAYGTRNNVGAEWNVRQAWLETEMWTVGVKVGEMPISLNDDILVNHDTTQFGTIMLSKSFNDTTVVLADVKVNEGVRGEQSDPGTGIDADEDDIDLYVLSILGKSRKSCGNGCINYQLTAAYLDAGNVNPFNTVNALDDTNNFWLAGTVGTTWNGIDLTGTVIYEDGFDNFAANTQEGEGDFLTALRMTGKTAWGSWDGYAFYAGKDFNNITPGEAGWSETWDSGGPGGKDLMANWSGSALTVGNTSMTENMMGVGAGLKFNAAGWVINPMIDYAEIVETNLDGVAGSDAVSESAWGGTLKLTHQIDTGVTFGLQASYVTPDDTVANDGIADDSMHYFAADLRMNF